MPVSSVPEFVRTATQAVIDYMPGIRPCSFGHVGDGNLHFNFSQPPEMERQDFLDHWHDVNRIVHDIVVDMGDSISAEHGIGLEKREFLPHSRSPAEIAVMRSIKHSLDPNNILNPGKIFQ